MKKKSLFFKSTLILIIGSIATKGLGLLVRIVFTRMFGTDGISLYSLIMPTYSLIISISQLGLPAAISTLVAKNNKRGHVILASVLPIIFVLNLAMIIIILTSAKFIAYNLLQCPNATYPIMATACVLPFISISSILRGYFFGKQNMIPHTVSNIVEQIARLIIIIIFLPILLSKGLVYGVTGFILLSAVSEIISIIVFLLYVPSKIYLNKDNYKPDVYTGKDILNICLPTVGGRLIGNIAYFMEPVILINVLQFVGYSNSFIINEYGIYNSYVIPLLVVPSFIVQSLSTALVPEISKSLEMRNKSNIFLRIKQSMKISLLLGLVSNTFVFIFARQILHIIYNVNVGIDYIRFLAPFFILYNLEGPLFSILQAIGQTKLAFRSTTIGIIIKTIMIVLLSFLKIGLWGLVISEVIDILIVVILNILNIYRNLKIQAF